MRGSLVGTRGVPGSWAVWHGCWEQNSRCWKQLQSCASAFNSWAICPAQVCLKQCLTLWPQTHLSCPAEPSWVWDYRCKTLYLAFFLLLFFLIMSLSPRKIMGLIKQINIFPILGASLENPDRDGSMDKFLNRVKSILGVYCSGMCWFSLYLYIFKCVCLCVCHPWKGVHGGQKRVLDPLKLTSQLAVSHLMWVLGHEEPGVKEALLPTDPAPPPMSPALNCSKFM